MAEKRVERKTKACGLCGPREAGNFSGSAKSISPKKRERKKSIFHRHGGRMITRAGCTWGKGRMQEESGHVGGGRRGGGGGGRGGAARELGAAGAAAIGGGWPRRWRVFFSLCGCLWGWSVGLEVLGGGGVSFVVIVAVDLGSQREESTAQLSREPSLGAGPCGPPHPGYVRGCVSMTCGVQAVMTCGE